MSEKILWTEKYRPKTLDELVLPERILAQIRPLEITPKLFYGPPGCGKTSAAKSKSSNYFYLNCSLTTSVDSLRSGSEIEEFILGYSLIDDPSEKKTVILDELEGVSEQFFKALRGFMETYNWVNWIATTNYISKIPPAVQSRFDCIDFTFSDKELEDLIPKFQSRLIDICSKENISITKNAFMKLIEKTLPDFRSALISLQSLKSKKGSEKITLEDVEETGGSFDDLFDHIMSSKDSAALFSYVLSNYSTRVDEVFMSLGRLFPEFLLQKGYKHLIGDVTCIVHKFAFESKSCIDRPLAMYCCCKKLNDLF